MHRLQTIENALIAINETVFQELCDSFLSIRSNNYSAFSRVGSQSGKQKTTKGTPDTFLLLPSGKYIFVEYSTNITAGVSKLEDDIKKCLDVTKTGIAHSSIDEIIICVNFNLTTKELQDLQNLLIGTSITLTVYTLDALALELHLHHRDLVNYYLGLSFDTGQVVSMAQFIDEYQRASKGIATPLNNPFQHREEELKQIKEAVHNNDFVILTGAPGVGKTKLALQAMEEFLDQNRQYQAFCISYKSHTLLEDLFQYFAPDKDYILFVDDANRIDAFSQITGFYRSVRKGNLKILVTVRDYAFDDVQRLCIGFSPSRIDIYKFNDQQITDIVREKPFEILNHRYQEIILRIADGNPRLAIMTAQLAKAEQNIYALADVSDLFEKYFSTFVQDDGEFAHALNIKCLGLIAFFHVLPYKDKEVMIEILEKFGLDYSDFIDAIDRLDKLELVEIRYDHVKIPEQNLATFFFYKAFIKDSLLSFPVLLADFYSPHKARFSDTIIPANNTFGYTNVLNKLLPDLRSHFLSLRGDTQKAYDFLTTFWFYLQQESLEFIYDLVQILPDAATDIPIEVTYENNAFSYEKDDVIELLGEFFRFQDNLESALQLAFEYVRKRPEYLPELIHKVREKLLFDEEDEARGFERQNTLLKVLLTGLNNKNAVITAAFFELAGTLMLFKFRHTKSGRGMSFYWYFYELPNSEVVHGFRAQIWRAVSDHFKNEPDRAFEFLKKCADMHPDVIPAIMAFDAPLLLGVIERELSETSPEHCKYVHDQIWWFERNKVILDSFTALRAKFSHPVYEAYRKLDWDRVKDKETHEFSDYKEYERLKQEEVRSYFQFKNLEEVDKFYDDFLTIRSMSRNPWSHNTSLDIIIDENLRANFELGLRLLHILTENKNEIGFIPHLAISNHLHSKEKADQIWEVIQHCDYPEKAKWELNYFRFLDDTLIESRHSVDIMSTIAAAKKYDTIHLDYFERYQKTEPNLKKTILQNVIERNESEDAHILLWMDTFDEHYEELGDDLLLIKKAYLQQDKLQDHFDYEGKGFLKILKADQNFLLEYVKGYLDTGYEGVPDTHRNRSFVWEVENIEEVLAAVFDLAATRRDYFGILEHFCNVFFRNIQGDNLIRAKQFLIDYCKTNHNDPDKMNIVVDILRHSMRESFEEFMLLFLSLNQDVEVFRKIYWRGNCASGSGDVILADIIATDWRNILSIVEKSTLGIKLIPLKKFLNEEIESSLRSGEWERQRRFLEKR